MTELPHPIARIELDRFAAVDGGPRTCNVFVILGDRPALIGCGHPANTAQLVRALRAIDVRPSEIDRVIVNSWSPSVIGGHAAFPQADIFVTSPDLVQPRAWNGWNDARRASFLGVADEVFERVDVWQRADLAGWLELAFPKLTNHLDFVPLRAGHTVAAGDLTLEVIAAPGPNAGHSLLWCAELQCCFAGDLELDGLPLTESAREYMVSLERAMELEPTWLMTSHGEPSVRARWTLKRLIRFCANYLSNAPAMLLGGSKSVLDVVDHDLGYLPDHPAVYIDQIRRHRPFLEELVASRVLHAEGEGLSRRYSSL